MKKGHFAFPEGKNFKISKLDKEIEQSMGWKRHELETDTNCYSGLASFTDIVDGVLTRIVWIVWTDDGITGYMKKDLTPEEEDKVKQALVNHNG